jgi:hypothetical protein
MIFWGARLIGREPDDFVANMDLRHTGSWLESMSGSDPDSLYNEYYGMY